MEKEILNKLIKENKVISKISKNSNEYDFTINSKRYRAATFKLSSFPICAFYHLKNNEIVDLINDGELESIYDDIIGNTAII